MSIADQITEVVINTTYEDIPADAIDYAKLMGLVCIGASLAGTTESAGKIVTDYVRSQQSVGEAGVFASGFKTSLENAAFANNASWHATEFGGISSPEVVSIYTVFPPLIAVAEKYGLSGQRMLEACIIGHEVQARVGLAVNPSHPAQSARYMNAGVMGILAVAVGISKLLKYSPEQMVNAISLAASQGCGIVKQAGSMAHYIESGFAGRAGMLAALMAGAGMTGRSDILEVKGGFCDIMSGGSGYDPSLILQNWGEPFRVLKQGEKPYPCCYMLQHFVEAAVSLKNEYGVLAENIAAIEVETNSSHAGVCRFEQPGDPEEAKFSITHGVAAGILAQEVSLASFDNGSVTDPAMVTLRNKIAVNVHTEWEEGSLKQPHPITVTLKNGETVRTEAKAFRGHPPSILTEDELVSKFQGLAGMVMDLPQVDRAQNLILTLDTLEDVSSLANVLTFVE